jgi:glutamate-1-semialdehyde 2,1-aminomutase
MDRSETRPEGSIPFSNVLRRLAASALRRTPVGEIGVGLPAPVDVPRPYHVAWLEHNLPTSFRKGERCQIYLRVGNRGSRHWHASHLGGRWVELVVYIGAALHRTARIPCDVAPGEDVLLTIPVAFPSDAEDDKWTVTVSFVEQNVAWFHESGMQPLVVDVRAEEPEQGTLAEACAIARRSNWGMWQPTEGVTRSRTGRRYPTFIEYAQGCRVRDPEGNEWIDYVMAGGAAVLGYANPEVQAAIARQLSSSAVVTLAHMLEIKVTQMLCDMIPCAEMVLFGKHGSDICTAAIRTARLHTGRRKVLYSGYHGWHDWYAETLQPNLKGPSEPSTLFRFDLNDASSFGALVDAHRGEIAAVILEPAAQAATLDGPTCDADPAFLRHVADVCCEQGCVLIFDEIVTGFRYPHGSVQRATGVIPDLTCLGKALSGGMPLSALVGRRDIMQTSLYAAYMPTFRGEVYSLAAAEAALQIHQRHDVPGKINDIGIALKDAINQLSRDLNVPGEMIGVPFRMIYRFDEPDAQQRVLMRTLLQQELLQRGILTYKGFMLPSIAHGALEVEQTLSAFRGALTCVQEVAAHGAFVRHLDIPVF